MTLVLRSSEVTPSSAATTEGGCQNYESIRRTLYRYPLHAPHELALPRIYQDAHQLVGSLTSSPLFISSIVDMIAVAVEERFTALKGGADLVPLRERAELFGLSVLAHVARYRDSGYVRHHQPLTTVEQELGDFISRNPTFAPAASFFLRNTRSADQVIARTFDVEPAWPATPDTLQARPPSCNALHLNFRGCGLDRALHSIAEGAQGKRAILLSLLPNAGEVTENHIFVSGAVKVLADSGFRSFFLQVRPAGIATDLLTFLNSLGSDLVLSDLQRMLDGWLSSRHSSHCTLTDISAAEPPSSVAAFIAMCESLREAALSNGIDVRTSSFDTSSDLATVERAVIFGDAQDALRLDMAREGMASYLIDPFLKRAETVVS